MDSLVIHGSSIANAMARNSVNAPLEMQATFQKKDINKIISSYVFEKICTGVTTHTFINNSTQLEKE